MSSQIPDSADRTQAFEGSNPAVEATILSGTEPLAGSTVQISAGGGPWVGSEMTTRLGPAIAFNGKLADGFGNYELLGEIARGGMGVVYRARDRRLHRIVALKMILAGQLASGAEVRRFYSEAESAAVLDHPGIVPIYEVGEFGGQHFFAMGFVDGSSLAARLTAGPLSLPETVQMTAGIADAVQYAHDHGVIHRDLKPANILLDTSGRPRITDFGLAKRTGGDSQMTGAGQVLGTPSYMPPEQAAGRVDDVSVRSDVYALGSILYAMLTGRPPFQAASVVDTLRQVIEKEPVRPRALNPDVPADLETICLKCLEKDPRKRYASAADVLAELKRFEEGTPIVARPIGPTERAWRWCRRRPILAALMGTTALSLIGLLIVLAVAFVTTSSALRSEAAQRKEANRQKETAQRQEAEANRQKEIAVRQESEANRQRQLAIQAGNEARAAQQLAEVQRDQAARGKYIAQMRLTAQAIRDGELGNAEHFLEINRPPFATSDFRGFEWHYLQSHVARTIVQTHLGPPVASLACSPVEDLLAIGRNDGTIALLKVPDGKRPREIQAHRGPVRGLAFLPDGTRLISAGVDGSIVLWDPADGRKVLTFEAWGAHEALAISRDGSEFAVATNAGTVSLLSRYATASSAPLARFPVAGVVRSLDWHPDGERLAVALYERRAEIWNVPRKAKLATLAGFLEPVFAVRFSADGEDLATVGWDDWKIWSLADLSKPRLMERRVGSRSVAWSHAGKTLAVGHDDWEVQLVGSDGKGRRLRTMSKWVTGVAWSRDDSFLAAADESGQVRVHRVNAPSPERTWSVGANQMQWALAFGPDGSTLLAGGEGGVLRSFDLEGKLLKAVPGFATRDIRTIDLSHDGKRAAVAVYDGTVRIVDPHTLEVLQTVAVPQRPWNSRAVWNRDDRGWAIATWDGFVRVLNESGDSRFNSPRFPGRMNDCEWDPNHQRIAFGGTDAFVRLWSPAANSIQVLGAHRGEVTSVAWDRTGNRLATSSAADGTVIIWDVSIPSKPPRILQGHTSGLLRALWSPDGQRIASCGFDRTVRIWDVASGEETLVLGPYPSGLRTLAWNQDGRRLAAAGEDGQVMLWTADE